MLTDTTRSPYAKVHALDGMKVKWTGGLWKERFDTCANSTVPQLKHMFDSKDISHVVENFKICAGDAEGDFDGTVFGDGDFYKWMESAIYTAYQTDNQLLKEEIENYIDLIGRAQQPDGYLSTKQIIGERTGNGVSCLLQRVCTRELPERIISLQLRPELQIIWSIFTKRQSVPARYRPQSARLIIWDLWKCTVSLEINVI